MRDFKDIKLAVAGTGYVGLSIANADTTPIQRQISCNIQNDKKLRVNANMYSI